jgi:hypothetical protein
MRQRRVAIIDQNGLILNTIIFDDTIGCTLPSGQTLVDAPDGGGPGGHFCGNTWFDSNTVVPSSLVGVVVVASSRIVDPAGVPSTSILNSTSITSSAIVGP